MTLVQKVEVFVRCVNACSAECKICNGELPLMRWRKSA